MSAFPSPTPTETARPPGFAYVPELVTHAEERALLDWLMACPDWREVRFRGDIARRRAMSFGARYLTQGRSLVPAPPLPPELATYRDRMIAVVAGPVHAKDRIGTGPLITRLDDAVS